MSVIYKPLAGVGTQPQAPQQFQVSPAILAKLATPKPIVRANYVLVITEPTTTKAGKAARNRKYSVQYPGGSWSLRDFCVDHGIGLPAMVARLRALPGGKYESIFMDIFQAMKVNRANGKYHNSGRKFVCPHCGEEFTKLACIHARRRKQRDSSLADSVLRAMPAEFFGESGLALPPEPADATPEA